MKRLLSVLILACFLQNSSAAGLADEVARAANSPSGTSSDPSPDETRTTLSAKVKELTLEIDSLITEVGKLNAKMNRKPAGIHTEMEGPLFMECPASHPWFISMCSLCGLCLLFILKSLFSVAEEDLEEAGLLQTTPRPNSLAGQAQLNMFDRHIRCQFLRSNHSLENWQSKRCLPPGKALKADGKTPAALRASYKFTVKDLCHLSNISRTVMFTPSVWVKSIFLATLSTILAYISQDKLYRGEEEMHRFLMGVNNIAGSLAFLTMLLVSAYVGSTVAKWHRTLGSLVAVTGRLADIACLIGNDLRRDPDRRIGYTFYRYLNLVHILTYKGLTEQFEFDYDDLEQSQLLEGKNERSALEQGAENPRDVVICWIGKLMNECYRTKRMTESFANDAFSQLTALRASSGMGACLHGFEAEPASWATLMIIIVHLQML
jgi:hypothetical protein